VRGLRFLRESSESGAIGRRSRGRDQTVVPAGLRRSFSCTEEARTRRHPDPKSFKAGGDWPVALVTACPGALDLPRPRRGFQRFERSRWHWPWYSASIPLSPTAAPFLSRAARKGHVLFLRFMFRPLPLAIVLSECVNDRAPGRLAQPATTWQLATPWAG